jgi:hypothetical protein
VSQIGGVRLEALLEFKPREAAAAALEMVVHFALRLAGELGVYVFKETS